MTNVILEGPGERRERVTFKAFGGGVVLTPVEDETTRSADEGEGDDAGASPTRETQEGAAPEGVEEP
jgi:hypothetical protein